MYEQFSAFADQLTLAFLDRTIAAGAGFAAQYMRGALMIVVALAAVLLWTRKLDAWWVARRVLIAMVVIGLLQVGTYNSYIREPFWTTIPNAIAGSFTGGAVNISVAQRFDKVSDAAAHVVAAADAQATGFLNFRPAFAIAFADGLMHLFIGICFAMSLIARQATALLISVGPYLLIAAIFDSTRHWVVGWFGKLLALMVWTLFIAALSEMMLAGSIAYIQRMAAFAAGLSERVDGLWKLVVWFLINAAVMIGLPYYSSFGAGAAGGGVQAGFAGALGIGAAAGGRVAGALNRASGALNRAAGRQRRT